MTRPVLQAIQQDIAERRGQNTILTATTFIILAVLYRKENWDPLPARAFESRSIAPGLSKNGGAFEDFGDIWDNPSTPH